MRPDTGPARLVDTARTLVLTAALLCAGCGAAVRASAPEADRIADLMNLRPGMVVADVGAGKGRWTESLATGVGPAGAVFATEVKEEHLDAIRRRMQDSGLDNVVALLGDQESTGLEADCCDAILLRLVYHHFEDPAPMRRDLWNALRPGGVLVVIDTRPQADWGRLEGVPERDGHGIAPQEVAADLTGDGWELLSSHPEWEGGDGNPFCLVFRRPAPAGSDPDEGRTGPGRTR